MQNYISADIRMCKRNNTSDIESSNILFQCMIIIKFVIRNNQHVELRQMPHTYVIEPRFAQQRPFPVLRLQAIQSFEQSITILIDLTYGNASCEDRNESRLQDGKRRRREVRFYYETQRNTRTRIYMRAYERVRIRVHIHTYVYVQQYIAIACIRHVIIIWQRNCSSDKSRIIR